MIWSSRKKILLEAVLLSIALMLFSSFIHYRFPARLISFAALLTAAYLVAKNLKTLSDLRKYTGKISLKIPVLFTLAGIATGFLGSVLYRYHLDLSLLPDSFYGFAIIAGIIGITEELVFRGFLQGLLQQVNIPLSLLFSTLSHTGYKCCLFLFPVIAADINIGFLAFWTFAAGILLGILRHFSGSIIPPLLAHFLFDLLVYAGAAVAPWWVW
jgi:membrane protease YdiL (CAAX protease family)